MLIKIFKFALEVGISSYFLRESLPLYHYLWA